MKIKTMSKKIGRFEDVVTEVYFDNHAVTRGQAELKVSLLGRIKGDDPSDIVKVDQKLCIKTKSGRFITTNNITNVIPLSDNGLRFITASGSCYDIFLELYDDSKLVHNLYENAKICDFCVSSKIKDTPAFYLLRHICC